VDDDDAERLTFGGAFRGRFSLAETPSVCFGLPDPRASTRTLREGGPSRCCRCAVDGTGCGTFFLLPRLPKFSGIFSTVSSLSWRRISASICCAVRCVHEMPRFLHCSFSGCVTLPGHIPTSCAAVIVGICARRSIRTFFRASFVIRETNLTTLDSGTDSSRQTWTSRRRSTSSPTTLINSAITLCKRSEIDSSITSRKARCLHINCQK